MATVEKKEKKPKKFAQLKVIAKNKSGRGIGGDPNDTVEAFEPHWDDFQQNLEGN